MIVVILVGAAAVLTPVLAFRFERDQVQFAWVASLWLEGELPYVKIFAHQWPGQSLIYLLIFKIGGVSEFAVRAVDFALHAFAAVSLAAIVSRISRPLFGLFAALFYATHYVQMGPWNTSNRETYQVALLLPVIWWVTAVPRHRRALDDAVALLSGLVLGLVFLVKPTAGLALLAVAWMVIQPSCKEAKALRGRRLAFGATGALIVIAGTAFVFRAHLPVVYQSIVTFNVSVYSKLSDGTGWSSALISCLQGLCLFPAVLLLLSADRRPNAWRVLAVHVALAVGVVVQAKGFAYQLFAVVPFLILWGVVFAEVIGERAMSVVGQGGRLHRGLAVFATASLLVFLPEPVFPKLVRYRDAVQGEGKAGAHLPPIWDATVEWLDENTKAADKILVYGLDQGVQFLRNDRPRWGAVMSTLYFRARGVNRHPLIIEARKDLHAAVMRDPPDWILAAKYDETPMSFSGIDSIRANPELSRLLDSRYVRLPTELEYVVYRRRTGQ